MENNIVLLKNKTNKKFNDMVDFILNQSIQKGWQLTVDSVLISKNNIIATVVLNNNIIKISPDDFDFSLCFNNRIYINQMEIQKYRLKGGEYNG